MATITDNGYVLKTQNEYFEEERQLYLDIDPSWNLDPSTPDGLKLAHDAELFSQMDEVALAAYNSKNPNAARGVELNIIGSITGAFRREGTPSTVTLTLTGTPTTIVPSGSLVESVVDKTQWATNTDIVIQSSGSVNVGATCTTIGAIPASIGTITRIVNTVAGWQGVTNTTIATVGTDEERDSEFRIRRANTVSRPGNNQVDSMRAALWSLTDVTAVRILENDTNTTDSDGVPAKSIAVLVQGGDSADIANAMYLKKSPGVGLHGMGTVINWVVNSPQFPANSYTMTFGRPLAVDINVEVTIGNGAALPANAPELIAQAIVDYSRGILIDASCGFDNSGFGIGEDVFISRIYTPINHIIGPYGSPYVSALTLNGSPSNVAIAVASISSWDVSNITVTVQ